MTSPARRIRDLVDLRVQPTVVRLQESLGADWIRESTLLTPAFARGAEELSRALDAETGTGAFLVGPYGCGKSHFLAWLAWHVGRRPAPPDVVALSLLNFRAETPLEDAVCAAVGIAALPGDRREGWAACMAGHRAGLLLLLDEVSEFLRSKPDRQRLTEDIRFLQFLGELAQGCRLVVVCAMQEAIERAAELDAGQYRKIKGRFPVGIHLDAGHVRDLVAGHLLVKRQGYREAVDALVQGLRAAFPDAPEEVAAIREVYPLHPATLDLLEEVRDRFARTRGVIDFVCARLAGDPTRGLHPFLDRPWGDLLTPDEILAHFEDAFALHAEFAPLSGRVMPWYRREMASLFDQEPLRELAWRVLSLLILVWLSPLRDGLTPAQASRWLLHVASRLDPPRNTAVVARILDTLADRGRWVSRREGSYVLDPAEDGSAEIERLLAAEMESCPAEEIALEELAAASAGAPGFAPFSLPRDRWQPRVLRWHHHDRTWGLWFGNDDPKGEPPGPALCIRLPWGTPAPARGIATVVPAPLDFDPSLRLVHALLRLDEQALSPDARQRLVRRRAEGLELLASRLRTSFGRCTLHAADGASLPPLLLGSGAGLAEWLDQYGQWLLPRTFPVFERFAPSWGPLPKEAWREFMRFATSQDLCAAWEGERIDRVRDGYLVPMGLLRRQGKGFVLRGRVEEHELVRRVLASLDSELAVSEVAGRLTGPGQGLVDDQVHALLVFLLLVGEIDLLREGRSYRELYESLTSFRQYDRVVRAHAMADAQLRALGELCDGLHVSRPMQWTAMAVDRAVVLVRDSILERVAPLRAAAERLEAGSALAGRVGELLGWCAALGRPGSPRAAVEQLVFEAGTAARLLSRLQSLQDLPARIDRQLREVERIRHLFGQPALAEQGRALGPAPGLDRPDALDAWLAQATASYKGYADGYRAAHDAFWDRLRHVPSLAPLPAVASSRHLGLQHDLLARERAVAEAERLACRGISNLAFQARCACGFDGATAPAEAMRSDAQRADEEIRGALRRFFGQDRVRRRVEAWLAFGVEAAEGARPYMEGLAAWPEVADLASFDEHLAGMRIVRSVPAAELVAALAGRTWEPDALAAAVRSWAEERGAPRVRIDAGSGDEGSVAAWCVARCLSEGVPLPVALSVPPDLEIRVEPEAVGAATQRALPGLRLPCRVEDQVARLVLDGRLAVGPDAAPLLRAAAEVVSPSDPASPVDLAALSALLYGQDERMATLAPGAWAARLERLACDVAFDPPPPLVDVLTGVGAAGWLVIDGLGLPLLPFVEDAAESLLPEWTLSEVRFARVGQGTTTDSFWGELAAGAVDHPMEKVDVIDRLLHERREPLPDLARLAVAELQVALRRIRPRLADSCCLAVFADHGFRRAGRGRGWSHGGGSELERTVPILLFAHRRTSSPGT